MNGHGEQQVQQVLNIKDFDKRKAAGLIQTLRTAPGVFLVISTRFDPETGNPSTTPQTLPVSIDQVKEKMVAEEKAFEENKVSLQALLDDLEKQEAEFVAATLK